MTTLKLFQVDAFTDRRFSGNPAAVVPLESWLDDELMQQIALENNLSETAFFVPVNKGYHIRWFTPNIEVNLCGHATLASAHVLFKHHNFEEDTIYFQSKSGELSVSKKEDTYEMIFPTDQIKQVTTPVEILKAFKITSHETYRGRDDYMVIVESQRVVEQLKPDLKHLATLEECRGVIITAPGNEADFVSRCFFPQVGVDEDPATGSAHTTLTPYWAKKLKKEELFAIQLSDRKGIFNCKHMGENTLISGQARTYLIGDIIID